MILMPLTFTITIGIGAGIVVWVVLQIVNQRWGEIHWLMWIVFLAFLLYFAQEAIKPLLG
jgi:AGZA family xanthine/uracil permease-like MFS transporter